MNCATFRARAGRKCHTLLTSNALRLRIGMRWQTEIPLHEIRAVRPYEPSDARLPGFRRVSEFDERRPAWGSLRTRPISATFYAPAQATVADCRRLSMPAA